MRRAAVSVMVLALSGSAFGNSCHEAMRRLERALADLSPGSPVMDSHILTGHPRFKTLQIRATAADMEVENECINNGSK